MLLLMYLVIVEKKLSQSCDQEIFGIAPSKKIPKQWRNLLSSNYPFLTLLLNQRNKNEYKEYHGVSVPLKSQVQSKHGSPTFLLSGSWSLVL